MSNASNASSGSTTCCVPVDPTQNAKRKTQDANARRDAHLLRSSCLILGSSLVKACLSSGKREGEKGGKGGKGVRVCECEWGKVGEVKMQSTSSLRFVPIYAAALTSIARS